ncbi:cellulose binding domain-containing protein [Actinoplanes sp. GCM10030250]|uniref:cellulose binding domain-containing protein n=1 Tax=Actinoplanes sp. GCM10030250 TaxID=3273376 RepID=UPI003610BFE2
MDHPPQPRPRRSPMVVLLDAMLSAVTAVQAGNLPGRRRPADGSPPRRTGPLWLVTGVLAVVGGTVVLVLAVLGSPGGLTSLPLPGKAAPAPPAVTSIAPPVVTEQTPAIRPTSATAKPSASARSSATATVPPSSSSTSAAAPPVLTADYRAANGSGLLGYRATVTLTAEGGGPSADWRLSVSLPRATLQIAAVSGATAEQEGAVWTFTPVDATRTVTPGTPVVIEFDVRGATLLDAQPTDCRVNDRECGGLSG